MYNFVLNLNNHEFLILRNSLKLRIDRCQSVVDRYKSIDPKLCYYYLGIIYELNPLLLKLDDLYSSAAKKL